ncbi:tryptophan-rich sensory protein [Marinicauda pacifica]|uniref:Tryptophan-rich sensory protein n=1 Tax=Marinicauda pacifica TaxID=1133559 RepID=A0A4S2H992_9PROT|nr:MULTISPECIES: TspO/MBR family protein [Marinicauda]TGY92376.1 tryptophan-rich sensory protein [Marinicauda pacifica]GGE48354.1 tryptophan-rich sensory protein [Marinicauda pacifica]
MADIFHKPRAGVARLIVYLVVFVGIALALNAWIFSTGAAQWSSTLENPSWSPPGYAVGAVWTILFALMALSLWLVDRAGQLEARGPARALVVLQYLINISWTWLYFGLENVANGFYVTVIAFFVAIGALIAIGRANLVAALVWLPLNLWLGFALALSYATWQLNV